MLTIEQAGLQSSLQDLGRPGYGSTGLGRSGVLDPWSMQIANLLLGNRSGEVVIEFAGKVFGFSVDTPLQIAVTGFYASIEVRRPDQTRQFHPLWQPLALKAGDYVVIESREWSCRHYLAVGGGFASEKVFGSGSTNPIAGIGGYRGRYLEAGDGLRLNSRQTGLANADKPARVQALPPGRNHTLRALPGPEANAFSDNFKNTFWETNWTVSSESNRMGCRLTAEIVQDMVQGGETLRSHAVLPGTVQVPPDSQPLVLLADAQTTGGYPRIANIIEADLWKLAHVPVGSTIRFKPVDHAQAIQALREQHQHIYRLGLAAEQIYR